MGVNNNWRKFLIESVSAYVLEGRMLREGTAWNGEQATIKIEYHQDFQDWYLTVSLQSCHASFGFLDTNMDSVEKVQNKALDRARRSGFIPNWGKMYNLISINEKTGSRTVMSAYPLTHDEACTSKNKLTEYSWRKLILEEINYHV